MLANSFLPFLGSWTQPQPASAHTDPTCRTPKQEPLPANIIQYIFTSHLWMQYEWCTWYDIHNILSLKSMPPPPKKKKIALQNPSTSLLLEFYSICYLFKAILTSVISACTSFRKPATRGEIEFFSSTCQKIKHKISLHCLYTFANYTHCNNEPRMT